MPAVFFVAATFIGVIGFSAVMALIALRVYHII